MANVVKKLTFGFTDYLVGGNIIGLQVRFTAGQDWTPGATITADIISATDFSDPDHPASITDYSVLYNELKGGRPAFVQVTGPTSGTESGYLDICSVNPFVPGPNAPCYIPISGELVKHSAPTNTYRPFSCMILINPNGTYMVTMTTSGQSVDISSSIAVKPIIIKTATISGDPAVNDVVTLTASEIYDTAQNTAVSLVNLFAKVTAGRRLVVYIQGAGLTLIPCELLPVYDTDYTTPVLFSGFTGIKFRGGSRTNYYGLYVKLASDGTLTATVEDRQVYS